MNSNTSYIKVVRTSPWIDAPGYLPSRIVMWKPDDETARQNPIRHGLFTTHVECRQPDGSLSFCWGHYDMSEAEASEDFETRVDGLLGRDTQVKRGAQ
jgi:hypothetical protein